MQPVKKTTPTPTATQKPNKPEQVLDIQKEFAALRTMYDEADTTNKINVLLLGESGTGKTFLARTMTPIVHVDSFDNGGAKNLRDEVASGRVIVDSRWEDENPWAPTQFVAWEKEMERRIKLGYFNYINSYMLDSATTWSNAIMNQILKMGGIPGGVPRFTKDYGPQKVAVQNWIKRLLSLPCNFILTGHLESTKDESSGRMQRRFMTTGKAAVIIPLLFDEIWVMDPKDTAKGTQYRILTQATGADQARSRLSADGKLDQYEAPDFDAMLKKAGVQLITTSGGTDTQETK